MYGLVFGFVIFVALGGRPAGWDLLAAVAVGGAVGGFRLWAGTGSRFALISYLGALAIAIPLSVWAMTHSILAGALVLLFAVLVFPAALAGRGGGRRAKDGRR